MWVAGKIDAHCSIGTHTFAKAHWKAPPKTYMNVGNNSCQVRNWYPSLIMKWAWGINNTYFNINLHIALFVLTQDSPKELQGFQ
jgi:hypothetical protein